MHYRMFFSSDQWLTAADLFDEATGKTREVTLTIAKVTKGNLVGVKGKKSTKPALHWKERAKDGGVIKPLGLCVANCQAVSQVAGSTSMDSWVDKRVTLYVEDVDIRGEGRRPAVRIRPFTSNQQRAARGEAPTNAPPPADEDARLEAEAAKFAAEKGGAR